MQPSASTHEEFSQHYTTAIDALCNIAQAYFYLGRLADAQHVLRSALHLVETGEAKPQDRLKLLLLYGQVLTVDHFLNDTDADLLFEPLLQARQIAERVHDQQGIADEPTRHLAWNALLKGDQDQALVYAQQALSLREAVNFKPHLPFDHLLLSDTYQARGDRANALLHAEIALTLASEIGSTEALAMANKQLERLNRQ